MKVLITGGTGFIGSRLALRCAADGTVVTVLGRPDPKPAEKENQDFLDSKGIDIVLTSVTEREKLFQATEGVDIIFHLAAAQHEMNVPDKVFRDVNVEGTRNMLDAGVKAGVKRFVHGSTIGVYGSGTDRIIDENTPITPDNIYGRTKAEGEEIVRSYSDRIDAVIIRISETYGPGDRRLLKLFRGIQKRVFFMIGKGRNLHQLLYVEDLVEGLLLATAVEAAIGKTMVLAGPAAITTNEMAEAVSAAVGVPLRRVRAPLSLFMAAAAVMETTLRPLGIQPPLHRRRMDFFRKSFEFSTEYANNVLGFSAKTSFRVGAVGTAKWYRESGLL